MKQVLVDTGPLVALLDAGDRDHKRCVDAARKLRGDLFTTWPVMTEAIYLLAEAPEAQDALLAKVEDGAIQIADLAAEDVPALRALMRRYRDLSMDLADASLVRVGERERMRQIFTLDRRDFTVYRTQTGTAFDLIP